MSVEVVYSDVDLKNRPKGCNNNKPLYRKRANGEFAAAIINEIECATAKKGKNIKVTITTSLKPLKEAEIVHSPQLIYFYETAFDRWKEMGEKRCVDFLFLQPSTLTQNNLVVECEEGAEGFVPAQVAPRVDALQRITKNIEGQICYFALDRYTPIFEDTKETLQADLEVLLTAVNTLLCSSEIHPSVYALTTHPGHHAGKDYYGGYCYLNQSAIASKLLQQSFERVAHIDIDYHAGNGTMSLFWDNPNIFFASLHIDPNFDYPYNAGFEDQCGSDNAYGYTMNVPLPPKTDIKEYLKALQLVKTRLEKFRPQVLVVSLGVDTLIGDFDSSPNGGFSLSLCDFSLIGDFLRSLHLPTLFVQEGGYDHSRVGEAVLRVLIGSSYDDDA